MVMGKPLRTNVGPPSSPETNPSLGESEGTGRNNKRDNGAAAERSPVIRPVTLAEHFMVKELAQAWKLSPAAVRRLFRHEPGVLRFGREHQGHKRDYVTLRIPASVAERVYARCMRPGPVWNGKMKGGL